MYTPILDAIQLPRRLPSALVRETDLFDFKREVTLAGDAKHSRDDVRADLAKDMASFANGRGGTIIIGAREERDGPTYVGISKPDADALHLEYDRSAQRLCSPSPRIVVREIVDDASGGALLLVVNVDPFPGAAVGCCHPLRPDSWRFPMRVGREPEFLRPERLPMLIDARHRRLYVLLASIPDDTAVQLVTMTNFIVGMGGLAGVTRGATRARKVSLSQEGGVLTLDLHTGSSSGRPTRLEVPLDDVASVWQEPGGWCLRLVGYGDAKPPKP